jgi:hypothetical protein
MKNLTCKSCATPFEITPEDERFYKLFDVPAPTKCPQCRFIRRLLERNTRTLYTRKCDATGQEIISQYHEDHSFPVYFYEYWWSSDKWSARDYAQEIDWNKPFFPQFDALRKRIPHMSAHVIGPTLVNSRYTNCTGYIKNCYLVFEADHNENCYYSNRIYHSLTCADCLNIFKCELCYECIDCSNCYNLRYSNDCENCIDSYFLSNCKSCKDCIGCINLRHKRYCIFNEQFTKEEYKAKLKKYDLETLKGRKALEKESTKFFKKQPHRNLHEELNENSLGDYLYNSKDAYYCFDCRDLEDCRYCSRVSMGVKNSMDYTAWGAKSEMMFECAACGDNSYNLKYCSTCTSNNSDLEYCLQCTSCHHCFGCIGLNHEEYCILNTKFSKEEYEKTVARLKKHMRETKEYGEYFPIEVSAFGYNESLAQELFPLTKEEALAKGYRWTEREKTGKPQTYKTPARIADTPDIILKETLTCTSCNQNFRITEPELKFYHQQSLPVPEKCFNCRHTDRGNKRNPKIFYDRTCTKCKKETTTTFPPESKTIIYCEKCYREEVN